MTSIKSVNDACTSNKAPTKKKKKIAQAENNVVKSTVVNDVKMTNEPPPKNKKKICQAENNVANSMATYRSLLAGVS